jgi:hypothetical protein
MPGQTHYKSRVIENIAGTAVAAADFALSAGFGSTGAPTPVAGSTDTRGAVDVAVAGSGIAANPTVTLTFKDGTFKDSDGADRVPFAVAARGDTDANTGIWAVTSTTTTTVVFTFVGTPVTGHTYRLCYLVKP